jgi:hypothetical protein
MSPVERIAAAIAAGDLSRREGERLIGFVALAGGPADDYPRATWYRRLAQLRGLGVDDGQLGALMPIRAPLASAR